MGFPWDGAVGCEWAVRGLYVERPWTFLRVEFSEGVRGVCVDCPRVVW